MNRRGFGLTALKTVSGLALAGVLPGAAAAADPDPRPLILLDPGHGGYDPGAISPDGVQEKDITLETGFALRRALIATGNYRVAMTRMDDVFVALEDRVAAAVAQRADLFLAMHCDHLPTAGARGASVFTLSTAASDGLAASVAAVQNGADGPAIPAVGPQVAAILASLETRAIRLSSATLAADIQNAFSGVIPLLPDPGRSANFAVLRDPSTPSTLLEMGCLTNPLDEKLLTNPAHRALIADRLTTAIDRYFSGFARAG